MPKNQIFLIFYSKKLGQLTFRFLAQIFQLLFGQFSLFGAHFSTLKRSFRRFLPRNPETLVFLIAAFLFFAAERKNWTQITINFVFFFC